MAETPANPKPTSSYLRRYGIDTVWAHLALNLASVLMLTLAFPKPGWAAMAFFAPVPVGVLAMRTTRLWTLGWTTFLVFGVWWALRIHWLSAVSPGAPWGVGLVLGFYMALMAVGLAAVQRRFRAALTLTLPIFWVAQEAIRSVWPWGGFPWFTLGSSQAMWKPLPPGAGLPFPSAYLVQTADLFGVLTVSFLVAMTAGLIVDLIARPLSKRVATGRVRVRRTVVVALLFWTVCFGGAVFYGLGSVRAYQTMRAEGKLPTATVTVIQTNVSQNNKESGTPEQHRADWDRLFELTNAALAEGPRPDLVVWPETMVRRPINDEYVALLDHWLAIGEEAERAGTLEAGTELADRVAYVKDERRYRTRLDDYARTRGVPLLVGGRTQLEAGGMNTAFLIRPGATSYPGYSKQQLVPFGEYIPGPGWVRDWFMKYISPYDHDYTLTPGARPVVFEVQARGGTAPASRRDPAIAGGAEALRLETMMPEPFTLRVAAPICFEDVVGHLCRRMVYAQDGTKRVDVLVNVTNDGWFAGTHQGWQHLQIATLRCIENRVPMARSVNTGVSGFIDSSGRVTEVVSVGGRSQEVDGHATAALVLDPRATLYARVGEAGPIGVCVAALLLWVGVWVPRRVGRLSVRGGAAGREAGARSA